MTSLPGNWLICPGLARAGTTYLFRAFAAPENAPYFQVPRRKETHWLERRSADGLEKLYGKARPGAWHLDFSPGYSRFPAAFAALVQQLPRDGRIRFIIMLRDPIEQAFAHYLHDLKEHVSRGERPEMRHALLGEEAARTYFIDRTPLFRHIRESFGDDQVLFLNFHTMFRDLPSTAARIADFLGIPALSLPAGIVNGGGWLPRFVHGGERGLTIAQGAALIDLPPRALLLVNGWRSSIAHDVDDQTALRALAGAATWQDRIEPHLVAALAKDIFASAIDGYSELLGAPIDAHRPRLLRAANATLPGDMIRRLRSPTTLADHLRHAAAGIAPA